MVHMQEIAQGKEAVLEFLENEALKRTNEQPGVYMSMRDDANQLVLYCSGFTFIGSGTVSLGGNLMNVVDGRLVELQKPS
jgi:hypothetical protein